MLCDCLVCGKSDEKKPMTFRGEKVCSELHRKIIAGELGENVYHLLDSNVITQAEAVYMRGR